MSEVDIAKLTQPFPKTALKQREGGRGKMLTYVEAHTVIHRLNDATGFNWDFKIVGSEWREDLLIVTGELTLPGMGTRTGIGVQKCHERGGEDLVKGASSDALKKAATLFGVGLELYGPDYEANTSTPIVNKKQGYHLALEGALLSGLKEPRLIGEFLKSNFNKIKVVELSEQETSRAMDLLEAKRSGATE